MDYTKFLILVYSSFKFPLLIETKKTLFLNLSFDLIKLLLISSLQETYPFDAAEQCFDRIGI